VTPRRFLTAAAIGVLALAIRLAASRMCLLRPGSSPKKSRRAAELRPGSGLRGAQRKGDCPPLLGARPRCRIRPARPGGGRRTVLRLGLSKRGLSRSIAGRAGCFRLDPESGHDDRTTPKLPPPCGHAGRARLSGRGHALSRRQRHRHCFEISSCGRLSTSRRSDPRDNRSAPRPRRGPRHPRRRGPIWSAPTGGTARAILSFGRGGLVGLACRRDAEGCDASPSLPVRATPRARALRRDGRFMVASSHNLGQSRPPTDPDRRSSGAMPPPADRGHRLRF